MTIRDFNSDRWYLPWIPVHKTWQMNILWQLDPPRLGNQDIDAWNITTPNLADEPTLADGPPTQWIKHRCLEYCYTKHGRQTYFGQWTLRSASRSIPQMHHGIYIMGCIWQPFCILQEKVRISCYFWKIRVVNSQLAWYSHVRCNPLDTPNTPETPQNTPTWQLQISTMRTHICQCEGTAWRYTMVNGCRMDGWMLFLMILCFVPRQLRFSLYSGAVITRTWFSL